MNKELIIYHDRGAQRHFSIFDCAISCDECPFRFRCFTSNNILAVSEGEYRDATEIIPGIKDLKLIVWGKEIRYTDVLEIGEYIDR